MPLELTNANASVAAVASGRHSGEPGLERMLFQRLRRGVFRVEQGLSHGTGFFVEASGGLVATNDHVVGNGTGLSIYLDSVTRVPATVVASDPDADLALLAIPKSACADCPRLPLSRPQDRRPLVSAGERLVAIGYPLSQEQTVTSGIASSVRDEVVISDVNMNPGNSGGPLLNGSGEVVAINTFGEASGSGPGLSGSVLVTKLQALIAKVDGRPEPVVRPEYKRLPVMPTNAIPVATLRETTLAKGLDWYELFQNRDAGRFLVSIATPAMMQIARGGGDVEVARERREREKAIGTAAEERYSAAHAARDWERYVGDNRAPVIKITAQPKIGETGWSSFRRGLGVALSGYSLAQAKLKFQGDVREVLFFRNGVEFTPLRGGHAPYALHVEDRWVELKDVADVGEYVLPPTLFAPDDDGTPPMVTIAIIDLKNPDEVSTVDIWGETSARVWNDFVPFFRLVNQGTPVKMADERRAFRLRLVCDAKLRTCK